MVTCLFPVFMQSCMNSNETNKQTNKQTNKRASKQASKPTKQQTNKQKNQTKNTLIISWMNLMKKGLANHPMTMTFTTHRDLPVCRNLSIGFLAKLPPCHSKGKIWWMLQSGSMKKLLAAITGLKSGLGCGKNSKIFEDYVVQYMFRYFMKLNLSQLIQKKFKVWFFKHAMKNLLYKQKKSPTLTIHLEKILWGTNTSACARKPYCVFPFKLRVLKTSPVAVRQLGEFVCHQSFASQKGRHFQIRGLR